MTSLHSRTASGRQARWSSGVPRGVRNGGNGNDCCWAWIGVAVLAIRIASRKSERAMYPPGFRPLGPRGLAAPAQLSASDALARCRCRLTLWKSHDQPVAVPKATDVTPATGLSGCRSRAACLLAFPRGELVFHLDVQAHQPFFRFAGTQLGLGGALLEH